MATKISRKDPDPKLFGFQNPDVDKIFTNPEKNKKIPQKIFIKKIRSDPGHVFNNEISEIPLIRVMSSDQDPRNFN
jgi:hypothetical protein